MEADFRKALRKRPEEKSPTLVERLVACGGAMIRPLFIDREALIPGIRNTRNYFVIMGSQGNSATWAVRGPIDKIQTILRATLERLAGQLEK